jgi:hypothetical protein
MSRNLSAIFLASSFFGGADDLLDGYDGLVDLSLLIELVRFVKLTPCDLDTQLGPVFGPRVFHPRFQLLHGLILGCRAQHQGKAYEKNRNGQRPHFCQRFFGSIAISRWRACHS